MEKKILLDEMIEKYRVLVSERYEFDSLEAKFILDESVTPELTDKVKSYFLNYIYPSKDQREILNKAFDDFNMGYASAMAWILLIITLLITFVQFKVGKKWVYYSGGNAK